MSGCFRKGKSWLGCCSLHCASWVICRIACFPPVIFYPFSQMQQRMEGQLYLLWEETTIIHSIPFISHSTSGNNRELGGDQMVVIALRMWPCGEVFRESEGFKSWVWNGHRDGNCQVEDCQSSGSLHVLLICLSWEIHRKFEFWGQTNPPDLYPDTVPYKL